MSGETETTSEVARVLLDHDAERMECMDHDRLCCPTCDAHDFASAYKHQAAMLAEAGLLRETTTSAEPCDSEVWSMDYYRDGQVDPYWIRCNAIGPHVEHEDANTGLTWTTDEPEEAQIATQEPAGGPEGGSGDSRPSGGLGERLRALAADMTEAPFTAAIIGQLADEAHRLEVHARVVEQSLRTARTDVARNGPTNEATENPFRMPEDRA